MKSDILEYLEARLKPGRLKHVLGARDAAVEIAQRHGVDTEKAAYAALLHDAAKWMTTEQQFAECDRYGIELDAADRMNPAALHAYIAAEFARERYDMPADVCQAIRAHTTAWVPMTPLDMALYVADFCEPGREYNDDAATIAREATMDNLFEGTLLTMTLRLRFLLEKGAIIHPRTVHARNAMLERQGAENAVG